MDLQRFLSRPTGSFSGAFESRYFNQDLSDEVRELAHRGLNLFPVSLAAKLSASPNELISKATCDISLLEELSKAAQPLWGYGLALGPSSLCVLVLDGALGRASLAALVPDLEECLTLQAHRGDVVDAFFRQPAAMKRIAGMRKLAPGVRIVLGDDESWILPPTGGAVWVNPGAEIETLPYALRELLESAPPDDPPGRAIPVPKPSFRPVPCRPAARFPRPNQGPQKGYPVCGRADWRGGYRISRRR